MLDMWTGTKDMHCGIQKCGKLETSTQSNKEWDWHRNMHISWGDSDVGFGIGEVLWWQADWMIDWLTDWLTGWLSDQVTDWVNVWLARRRIRDTCRSRAHAWWKISKLSTLTLNEHIYICYISVSFSFYFFFLKYSFFMMSSKTKVFHRTCRSKHSPTIFVGELSLTFLCTVRWSAIPLSFFPSLCHSLALSISVHNGRQVVVFLT